VGLCILGEASRGPTNVTPDGLLSCPIPSAHKDKSNLICSILYSIPLSTIPHEILKKSVLYHKKIFGLGTMRSLTSSHICPFGLSDAGIYGDGRRLQLRNRTDRASSIPGRSRRNGASYGKFKFHKKSMFPFGVWLGSLYRRETSDTTKTWCQMGVLAHYVAKLILGARPT